ncbi:MAG: hypothetical protein AAFU64_02985 [Bacteroidota bacterium]
MKKNKKANNIHALIIGNNTFQDYPGGALLPQMEKQLLGFKNLLADARVLGVKSHDIYSYVNGKSSDIYERLLSLSQDSHIDVLLVYCSGMLIEKGNEYYLMSSDARSHLVEDTAINITRLVARLQGAKAGKKILMLDGVLFQGKQLGQVLPASKVKNNTWVLSQISPWDNNLSRKKTASLSQNLIKVLREEPQGLTRWSLRQLFQKLESNMAQMAPGTTLQLWTDSARDVFLFGSAETSRTPVSALGISAPQKRRNPFTFGLLCLMGIFVLVLLHMFTSPAPPSNEMGKEQRQVELHDSLLSNQEANK